MNSAQIGYALGVFLATGGCGYLLLGLLKLVRVYRRWPRGSYVAACLFALLIGAATAAAEPEGAAWLAIVGSVAASGFLAWRGWLLKTAPTRIVG